MFQSYPLVCLLLGDCIGVAALSGGVGDCVIGKAGRDMLCLWRDGGRRTAVGGFQSFLLTVN